MVIFRFIGMEEVKTDKLREGKTVSMEEEKAHFQFIYPDGRIQDVYLGPGEEIHVHP